MRAILGKKGIITHIISTDAYDAKVQEENVKLNQLKDSVAEQESKIAQINASLEKVLSETIEITGEIPEDFPATWALGKYLLSEKKGKYTVVLNPDYKE